MKKTFIIASTGDRYEQIKTLISSIRRYLDEWYAVFVLQNYSQDETDEIKRCTDSNKTTIFSFPEMIGANRSRLYAINNFTSDVWCSLDDDMIICDKTDFDKMADIVLRDPEIGLLSGNWARTESLLNKKKIEDVIIKQKIVYTGGGLVFRDDVAGILRKVPNEAYVFDNPVWAVYAYCAGYTNYRYKGSITIHKACMNGGRRRWLKDPAEKKVLPPSDLLRVRTGTQNGYDRFLICDSSDVTKFANNLHAKNKERRFGNK